MTTGNQSQQPKFLTVAEVAEQARVSRMTVYRLVHSGELPAVRVGKSYRVPEQAIIEYLENNSVTQQPQQRKSSGS